MGSRFSRTVEIQICNRTRSFTLKNPRTHFYSGYSTHPAQPSVPPGSSASCSFTNRTLFWGCNGVLVYEAESFTVAVYFSNPVDYNRFSPELGLELSLNKAHLGKLKATYSRMVRGSDTPAAIDASDRVVLDDGEEPAHVSAGPVKVTATVSNASAAVIKVEVEEVEQSGKNADGWEEPCPKKFSQNKPELWHSMYSFVGFI